MFVPPYAITASGMLLPIAAPILGIGIVVSPRCLSPTAGGGSESWFRGFQRYRSAAAFYLFLLICLQSFRHWQSQS